MKNVHNVKQNHKLHLKCHGKLEIGIEIGWLIQAEVKIQKGLFLGDSFSPLLFVIAMIPHHYKFTNSQEKINHHMYLDNIKLFAKNEKKKQKARFEQSEHTARI